MLFLWIQDKRCQEPYCTFEIYSQESIPLISSLPAVIISIENCFYLGLFKFFSLFMVCLSILLLSGILLHRYTIFCSLFHQLLNRWVVSTFEINAARTFKHKFLCEHIFLLLSKKHLSDVSNDNYLV